MGPVEESDGPHSLINSLDWGEMVVLDADAEKELQKAGGRPEPRIRDLASLGTCGERKAGGSVDLILGNLIPEGLSQRLRDLEADEQRGYGEEKSTTGTECEGDRWGTEADCSPRAAAAREEELLQMNRRREQREAALLAHPSSDWLHQF